MATTRTTSNNPGVISMTPVINQDHKTKQKKLIFFLKFNNVNVYEYEINN